MERTEKETDFSPEPEELEIIELPEREAMLKIGPLKIHLNNIRLFNNL
ncbi:MAG: hypothetical protein AB1679_03265 [Actinomycetota bacterium]|jgi:hypothetical protein